MTDVKQYPFYWVEWVDPMSDTAWEEREKVEDWAKKQCLIIELGFVIYEDRKQIVLCNQFASDGEFGNRTKIPKVNIKKKQKLRVQFVRKQ
jgi:hypothetical protein